MADVKREIHDAYAMFKLKRDGAGGDPVSGGLHAMARRVWAGRLMAAVEKQRAPLGDLLLLCYAPEWEDQNFLTVHRCLWGEFLHRRREDIKQDRTLLKARVLAEVAVFGYQAQARGRPFSVEMICEMAQIDRSHWYKPSRMWRPWYEQMGRILWHWERQALCRPREVCEQRAALRSIEGPEMAAD